MRTYRVTGTYDFSVVTEESDNFELVITAENEDEVDDIVSSMLADDVEELYDFNINSCVDITVAPAPAAPAHERLVIIRADGSTYTCYGTYQDMVAMTRPEIPEVQGTRVTDPIILHDGTVYRPIGTVERA